jgi:hypothetical protein
VNAGRAGRTQFRSVPFRTCGRERPDIYALLTTSGLSSRHPRSGWAADVRRTGAGTLEIEARALEVYMPASSDNADVAFWAALCQDLGVVPGRKDPTIELFARGAPDHVIHSAGRDIDTTEISDPGPTRDWLFTG